LKLLLCPLDVDTLLLRLTRPSGQQSCRGEWWRVAGLGVSELWKTFSTQPWSQDEGEEATGTARTTTSSVMSTAERYTRFRNSRLQLTQLLRSLLLAGISSRWKC